MINHNLVIRDNGRFHLRINGRWHKRQTWDETRRILILAGLDPHKMMASAIKVSEPLDIEYRPLGRHRWWLNGCPVPIAWVRYALREAGCDKEVIGAILHANKLIYEVGKNAREGIVARQ